jgi:hypothetical protein
MAAGEAGFGVWSDGVTAIPAGRTAYADESAKMDLWLQLVGPRPANNATVSVTVASDVTGSRRRKRFAPKAE